MKYGRLLGAMMLVAGLGFVSAANLVAQEQVPQEPVPQEEPQEVPQEPVPEEPAVLEAEAVEITTELLERFVEVYPTVMEIAEATQVDLATAESTEEAQAIQAAAQERIASILAEADVTVEEYEAVVARLNEDEELRHEFEQMLEERQAEEPGEVPGG